MKSSIRNWLSERRKQHGTKKDKRGYCQQCNHYRARNLYYDKYSDKWICTDCMKGARKE